MEIIGLAVIVVAILFFTLGGDDMVANIFKHKADAARERRLEAEAHADEARAKNNYPHER